MKGAIARAEELQQRDPRLDRSSASSRTPPTRRSTARPRRSRSGTTPTAGWTSSSRASARAARSPASAEALKARKPALRAIAVEPTDSPVLSGGAPGPHKIQGIGAGFVPKVLRTGPARRDRPGHERRRRSPWRGGWAARRASWSASPRARSTWAALQVAKRPEMAGKLIVAILASHGERYLSTPLFDFPERRGAPAARPATHAPDSSRTSGPSGPRTRRRAARSRSCCATRACTRSWCTGSRTGCGAGACRCCRGCSRTGPLLHRHRDPPRRHHRPARVHRPRHGRGDRRDRGGRRRLPDLPGRHAGRHEPEQGKRHPTLEEHVVVGSGPRCSATSPSGTTAGRLGLGGGEVVAAALDHRRHPGRALEEGEEGDGGRATSSSTTASPTPRRARSRRCTSRWASWRARSRSCASSRSSSPCRAA